MSIQHYSASVLLAELYSANLGFLSESNKRTLNRLATLLQQNATELRIYNIQVDLILSSRGCQVHKEVPYLLTTSVLLLTWRKGTGAREAIKGRT